MEHKNLKIGKFYQIYRCFNGNELVPCSLYSDKECMKREVAKLYLSDVLFLLSFNLFYRESGFADQFSLKVLTSDGKIGYIWSGLDSKLIIKEINEF